VHSIVAAAVVVGSLRNPSTPVPPVELIHSIDTNPSAGLLQDNAGNFYGTTEKGGAMGYGTVFKLAADGTYSSLHDFAGVLDGQTPLSDLVSDAGGNLYGTTEYGGDGRDGVVFKVTPNGTETVLYSFEGDIDGANPLAGVVMDSQGNLYGTTYYGGGQCSISPFACGTVFKVTADGSETVLHAFSCADGCFPISGLILDKKGDLYGTTYDADTGGGTIFEITTRNAFKTLFTFKDQSGGINPTGRLLRDKNGNLYGTTNSGGANGYGTVFRLATDGSETVLHSFTYAEGALPRAGVITDRQGNIYGTASAGGNHSCGTVFRLTPDGHESTIHTFFPNQYVDGCGPRGELLQTKNGNLYGTTYSGGPDNQGTMFVITP
jgi:uncharacterized repeat protein (TIGR03803 family)